MKWGIILAYPILLMVGILVALAAVNMLQGIQTTLATQMQTPTSLVIMLMREVIILQILPLCQNLDENTVL